MSFPLTIGAAFLQVLQEKKFMKERQRKENKTKEVMTQL
jgi:hypothetical protein